MLLPESCKLVERIKNYPHTHTKPKGTIDVLRTAMTFTRIKVFCKIYYLLLFTHLIIGLALVDIFDRHTSFIVYSFTM